MLKLKFVGLVQRKDKGLSPLVGRTDPQAVDQQKHITRRKSRSFIAIHKGMILRQAFPECGRLLDKRRIVSRLWTKQCRLKKPRIAYPMLTTVSFDLICISRVRHPRGCSRNSLCYPLIQT